MLPDRRTLLVAGEKDIHGLVAMADFALPLVEDRRFESTIPLRMIDGTWEAYHPPAGHPAFGQFHEFWLMSLDSSYRAQRDPLAGYFNHLDSNIYVAEHLAGKVEASEAAISMSLFCFNGFGTKAGSS